MSSGQNIYIGPMIQLYPGTSNPPHTTIDAHNNNQYVDDLFRPNDQYIIPNSFTCGQIQWDKYTYDGAPFDTPIALPDSTAQQTYIDKFTQHPAVMAYTQELTQKNIPFRIAYQIIGYFY